MNEAKVQLLKSIKELYNGVKKSVSLTYFR
jgi:hypothetical protein